MKSKSTIKKLEFNKETIVRLESFDLFNFRGGKNTDTQTVGKTKPGNTCTCLTHASDDKCEG